MNPRRQVSRIAGVVGTIAVGRKVVKPKPVSFTVAWSQVKKVKVDPQTQLASFVAKGAYKGQVQVQVAGKTPQVLIAALPIMIHPRGPEGIDVAMVGWGSGITAGTAVDTPPPWVAQCMRALLAQGMRVLVLGPSVAPLVAEKLREPVLMMTGLIRALNGQTDGAAMGWWWGQELRQHVFTAPSVFSFYPPNYPVTGTPLVGPAFGIYNVNTAFARLNYLNMLLFWDGMSPDTSIPGATGFPQGRYTSDVSGDLKSIKTLNLVTPILLAAGGAMLVGGLVMIVIDRGNKKKGKGFYANRPGHGVQLGGIGAAPLPGGGAAGSLALHF